MSSTTIPIRDIPQWQLFQSVLPVFQSDLKWEPRSPEPYSNASVDDSVRLLRHQLTELSCYVGAHDRFSVIYHAVFVSLVGTLLSTMQKVVDLNIPHGFEHNGDLDRNSLYSDTHLQQGWPGLLSLAYLLSEDQEWSSHIVLQQDPSLFRTLQGEAEVFLASVKTTVLARAVETAEPQENAPQIHDHASQVNRLFCGYSARLFEAIVRHTQKLAKCTCPETHRALLHLKGPSDAHDDDPTPELTLFMACCPERSTWQQVLCAAHVDSPASTADPNETVDDICELTRCYFESGCILKMELKGDTLFNKSDEVEEMNPSMLDNASLSRFTLGELLRQGVFREGYKVFPNDKRILAYILARALLCLYGGPWLQTPWTADKLVFRYDADAKTIYNIHQPYISCDLLEDLPPVVSRIPMHKYPLILAFAKVLVDLDRGSVEGETDMKPGLLKYVKAYYEAEKDRSLSPGFAMALGSSIRFNKCFDKIRSRNPNATVQDAILEGIVKPLERDVHMDSKNQWGCRNVRMENDTPAMARPTVSTEPPVPIPEPPRPQEVVATPSLPLRLQKATEAPLRPARNEHNGSGRAFRQATKTLFTRPQAGSLLATNSTTPSRLSGRISTTTARTRPASRPISPDLSPVPRTATRSVTPTGAKSFKGQSAVQNKSAAPAQTNTTKHVKSPSSNTVRTTASVGSHAGRTMPEICVNGEHASFENGPRSPSFDGELDDEVGPFGARMFSVPGSTGKISATTFGNINDKADEYLQHTDEDTPIKVAVIDTGIDLDHADFERARTKRFRGPMGNEPCPAKYERPQKERIRAYKNFCKDQHEDNVSDLDGHGTQVAGIILRLAPNAELYIARVCTGDINYGLESHEKRRKSPGMVAAPEPEAVQQAIAWAISEGVDIINLSLGYRNANIADVGEFRTMLRDTGNAIVFAATSNQGAHDEVAWPARDRRAAIGIHSCGDSGTKPSDFSARPLDDIDNFMTVGENILSQWPTYKGGGFRLCSGTSFATPVATAVGALVLEFAQQECQSRFRDRIGKIVNLEDLRTTDGMRKVLREVSTRDNSYRWIHSKLFWNDCRDHGEHEKAFEHAWAIIERALDI